MVLATGKPPWAIAGLAARLGLSGPHVVANGCALWARATGCEVLARIPDAGVTAALAYARRHAIPVALSGPAGVFCAPDWGVPEVTAALAAVGEEPPVITADPLRVEPSPWKVILILQAGPLAAAAPATEGGQWVRTHPRFYETLPAHASKARAVRLVCARLGVGQADVIAIGDSANDTELLRFAGTGIAMAHAPHEVREAAASITAGNDDDGVALAVEALLGERPAVSRVAPGPGTAPASPPA